MINRGFVIPLFSLVAGMAGIRQGNPESGIIIMQVLSVIMPVCNPAVFPVVMIAAASHDPQCFDIL